MNDIQLNNRFIDECRGIITTARTTAIRSVEFHRVEMYWKLGQRIVEEEQQGNERADYGSFLLKNLSIKRIYRTH